MATYRCITCGQDHDGLPDIGATYPDPWFGVPEVERSSRVQWTSDTCRIDDDYFIRGVILIPVVDYPQSFGFGAWISQSKENFESYVKNYNSPDIGPFFGWLCTRIHSYQPADTYLLKTKAHFVGHGQRPLIEVEPTDHPLALDQQNGITLARAWEMVHDAMPKPGIDG
ncbi:MAG TPA: DUF2199 domain-containing protein [Fimbriiglobus sp.]|jgi:hypothetical protein